MDQKIAKECLFHFADAMEGFCPFFLIDGTLLGAIREGGFISYDIDVDVGIWEEDFDEAIFDLVTQAGFIVKGLEGAPDDGLLIKLDYKGVRLDVFGFQRGETYTTDMHHSLFRLRAHLRPFSLASTTFLGRQFLVPDPPEQYLEDGYGPDWRQPTKNWHFRYSPPNLRVIGGPVANMLFRFKRWWRMRRLNG